jgi:deazaflavin-dependent oxidoreductase (nitroreductase family)
VTEGSARGGATPRRALARVFHVLALGPGARGFMRLHSRLLRWTRGRFPKRWFGPRLILLETTGRRTGRARRNAIVAVAHRDGWIVTTANAGLDRRPSWAYNLDAIPDATVYNAGRRFSVRTEPLTPAAAAVLWQEYLAQVPTVVHFQTIANRPFDLYYLHQKAEEC